MDNPDFESNFPSYIENFRQREEFIRQQEQEADQKMQEEHFNRRMQKAAKLMMCRWLSNHLDSLQRKQPAVPEGLLYVLIIAASILMFNQAGSVLGQSLGNNRALRLLSSTAISILLGVTSDVVGRRVFTTAAMKHKYENDLQLIEEYNLMSEDSLDID